MPRPTNKILKLTPDQQKTIRDALYFFSEALRFKRGLGEKSDRECYIDKLLLKFPEYQTITKKNEDD